MKSPDRRPRLLLLSICGAFLVAIFGGYFVGSRLLVCPQISKHTLLLAATASFNDELSKLSFTGFMPSSSCEIMNQDTFADHSSALFAACFAEINGKQFKYGIGFSDSGAIEQSSMEN